ncbi:high mobility group 20B, partial [Homo sapiens]
MSHGPKQPGAAAAPAGGKAPGQHGGFVVTVKQERGEGPRAGEKGSHEEEPGSAAGEETRLAQGQEAEEDSAEWAQGTGHGLRALPERAARADPHAPPGSALSRDHQDAGRRVEQAAANGKAGFPCFKPSGAAPQRYLDEAEREKQQYMKELRAYQQSEAYKMCTEKIQEKKIKKEDSSSGLMNTLLNGHKGGDCDGFSTFDVPIFTEEFLDQNKAREAELRRLRKMNVAFEEQNAVLQRHTQSMSSARERLEQELALEERRTLALQQQLQAVRQALTASFASLPVP